MKKFFVILIAFLSGGLVPAQTLEASKVLTNAEGSKYQFEIVKLLPATSVKNQHRTGTCWSFSGMSFLESEALRMGKPEMNLSEMWIARHAYVGKAKNYLLRDGHNNFGQGGLFHDIPWVVENYGLVPEKVYPGLNYGEDKHNHNELHAVLSGMLKALNKKPQNGHLTTAWLPAYKRTLDAYLGEVPDNPEDMTFVVKGKIYTPKSYAEYLGIEPENYVELTSFTHHPFYTWFALEIPDNWNFSQSFNVPVDELTRLTENALMKGYTVAWGADVSEKGFSHKKGLAIVPEDERTVSDSKSNDLYITVDGEEVPNGFLVPVKEKTVTQQMRQDAFERKFTTDDHGMHIIGIAKDQNGKKYFIVKNSWGDTNDLHGYLFVSYPYFQYKTTMIMLHKDALPSALRQKMKR